ncbi:MAG: bifunctional precorrin-2 dehydrogenase/sirohydrochlorin ferrochelatase [bacterium]
MTDNNPIYFPIMLDLRERKCVVIGGGKIARRKIDGLIEAGAKVTVIAPKYIEMPTGVEIINRKFEPQDLNDAWLVIAATDSPQVNSQVAEAAAERRVWVNVVDEPQICTAIMPAVIRRGMLSLAISTSGACPVWARRLRDKLADQFGVEYGEMLELLWQARQNWKERAKRLTPGQRKQVWEDVLDLPILDLVRNEKLDEAEKAIMTCLENAMGGTVL